MSPGIVILVLAVVAAAGFGLHRRRVDGRFAGHARTHAAGEPGTGPAPAPAVAEDVPHEPSAWERLSASVPHAELGERATLVQFSSAFCAPCRTTRVVLADVAERHDGIAHVEVDAEQHLALVRELDVRRTPTTLVLDRAGREVTRAAGAPRREQVLAALPLTEESR
ncbi:thiol-disulfide isomerase/thioredoxin [Nocardioides sp. J9]|uniref:TlpA family protein disulfide reductase n=1 Tax=unclassified Nocardioides TaxID=2615069 RepID=UPI00048F7450|nr:MULTISPECIES: thioredoxin family protein [unclassified Nocardioides]TWG93979.1 thiol-disulfide isomerase/thioredoxin [Nocardioides sp. J9]